MKIYAALPLAVLVLLLAGAIWGKFAPLLGWQEAGPEVKSVFTAGVQSGKLYVVAPGLRDRSQQWEVVKALLLTKGDVAMLDYPTSLWSNADPDRVALRISEALQKRCALKKYQEIVIIGNSMGALLARKALLFSAGKTSSQINQTIVASPDAWYSKVRRIILLAGMNRGWDLSGQRPTDMRWYKQAYYGVGIWLGNFLNIGQHVLRMQVGSPFVADLRVEWMRWMNQHCQKDIGVVQLLGDIDDLVTADDTRDLQVSDHGNFAWLKVRGTGHTNILDMQVPVDGKIITIKHYRYKKFHDALTLDMASLVARSEVLSPPKNDKIKRVVFIVHGVRDLGEWPSEFETALQAQVTQLRDDRPLAIASVRYGYFGMGQFLLRRDREKYVRWFMDQYTETLASYPAVEEVHFIGHSNGTYLLASALGQYRSLKMDRLVLAGSVVPRDYDWNKIFAANQVQKVRNYVADDDLVVALFPRFFETEPMRRLDNTIGSAGFNGFTAVDQKTGRPLVENVAFIHGGHDAFMDHVEPIAQFLIPTAAQTAQQQALLADPPAPSVRSGAALKFYSDYLTWTLWAFLAFVVLWLGARISWAAGPDGAIIALLLYVFVLLQVLRWA